MHAGPASHGAPNVNLQAHDMNPAWATGLHTHVAHALAGVMKPRVDALRPSSKTRCRTAASVICHNARARRYAEKFRSQAEAEDFCRIAGGTLGVPASKYEESDVERLLDYFLAVEVRSNFDVPQADFILWMGLRKTDDPMQPWQGMRGAVELKGYQNWASGQPSRRDGHDCTVLGRVSRARVSAWYSYRCGWSNMALGALCKLPTGQALDFPKGGRLEATQMTGCERVLAFLAWGQQSIFSTHRHIAFVARYTNSMGTHALRSKPQH